jgi:hypothetical protein
MGFLHSGPFGSLNGRTGNNVGRWTKGKNVFAIRPHKSSKPATPAQVDVRTKFSLITSFLSYLAPLIDVGFAEYDSKMSPMNAAVGYNVQRAIVGISPDFEIDYSKIVYSRGTRVASPTNATVLSTIPNSIGFSWNGVIVRGEFGSLTDTANFVVYNPEKGDYVILDNAVDRSAGLYVLQTPAHFAGDLVHCYMSFDSLDKKASKSIWVGSLNVL